MSFGIIYYIRNIENNKLYIGQTVKGLARRWCNHKDSAFNRGTKHPLYDSMRKYGPDGFETGLLASPDDREALDQAERLFIALFDTQNLERGYNLTSGGQSDFTPSPETLKRFSAASKGRKVSAETIAKVQASRAGYRHSEETKRKMSDAQRGRTLSEEHRSALRNAWTKRDAPKPHTDEQRRNISDAVKKHWETRNTPRRQPTVRKRFFTAEHIAAITAAQRRRREQERVQPITAAPDAAKESK